MRVVTRILVLEMRGGEPSDRPKFRSELGYSNHKHAVRGVSIPIPPPPGFGRVGIRPFSSALLVVVDEFDACGRGSGRCVRGADSISMDRLDGLGLGLA